MISPRIATWIPVTALFACFLSTTTAVAQFPGSPAAIEKECLVDSDPSEAGNAPGTITTRYGALLESRGTPACSLHQFRSFLINTYYPQYMDGELCLADRLTRAIVTLRYILDRESYKGDPLLYRQTLDRALTDIRMGIGAVKDVKIRPRRLELLLPLAERWCVDIDDPAPVASFQLFYEELLDSTVDLSISDPVGGKRIGAVLEAVAEDTRLLFDDAELEQLPAAQDLLRLTGFGSNNYPSASGLYRFENSLDAVAGQSDSDLPNSVPEIVELLEREQLLPDSRTEVPSPRMLEWSIDLLEDKEHAAAYFRSYAERLLDLAAEAGSGRELRPARDLLIEAAAKALFRGIQLASSAPVTESVSETQEQLGMLVLTQAADLKRRLDFKSIVRLESHFVEPEKVVLPSRIACHFHKDLAMAHYVLGSSPKLWLDHFRSVEIANEEFCRISMDELNEFNESVQSWVVQ